MKRLTSLELFRILIVFVPAMAIISFTDPHEPSDYYGHLITGREIPFYGRVTVDTLNIIPVSNPVFHDWLGKKILYLTYPFRKIFKFSLFLCMLILIIILSRNNLYSTLLPSFFLLLYFHSPYLRPMTLTVPLFALVLLLLSRNKFFYAGLTILFWSQIHLSWLIGYFVFIIYYLLNNRYSILSTIYLILIPIFVVALHPYHVSILKVMKYIPDLRRVQVTEWRSPSPQTGLGVLFYASTVLTLSLIIREKKFLSKDAIVFYLLTLPSLYALRNAVYQVILSAYLSSKYLPHPNIKVRHLLTYASILTLITAPLVLSGSGKIYKQLDSIAERLSPGERILAYPGVADYLEFKVGVKALTDSRALDWNTLNDAFDFYINEDTSVPSRYGIQSVVVFKGDSVYLCDFNLKSTK